MAGAGGGGAAAGATGAGGGAAFTLRTLSPLTGPPMPWPGAARLAGVMVLLRAGASRGAAGFVSSRALDATLIVVWERLRFVARGAGVDDEAVNDNEMRWFHSSRCHHSRAAAGSVLLRPRPIGPSDSTYEPLGVIPCLIRVTPVKVVKASLLSAAATSFWI